MPRHLTHFLYELRTRLWVRPLVFCLAAIVATALAKGADLIEGARDLPEISPDTIETLLSIVATAMLPVATFAVGSIVSAYASASESATPRSFELILADNLSQTALSTFIGAFIFSIVAIIAAKTETYGQGGRFALFVLTVLVIGWVILTFVRWVDDIVRLGQMPTTIDRAEAAARRRLDEHRRHPRLGGRDASEAPREGGMALHADAIGYLQVVDMEDLQKAAEAADLQIRLIAVPGTFVTPDQPVAQVFGGPPADAKLRKRLLDAFVIDDDRTFEADPRFGLIVLSEIAQRSLSTGVNDPGTAIVIVGRLVRLFAFWLSPRDPDETAAPAHDRIFVPRLELADLFDDAFTSISCDGAGSVEFNIRLQKAFASLAALGDGAARAEAARHARLALARAEQAIPLKEDFDRVRRAAFIVSPESG